MLSLWITFLPLFEGMVWFLHKERLEYGNGLYIFGKGKRG